MKYETTINHAGISSIQMTTKTDLVDWCLLDYIANFETFEKAKKLNGKVWINFKHLISEMPILGLNTKSSVSMRFKKLRELGLLETTQSVADQKLYAQTSELYKTASNFCAHTVHDEKPTVQIDEHPVHENEHKAVNKDYLINNLKDISFSCRAADVSEKSDDSVLTEKEDAVIELTSDQQECFDWASSHTTKNGFSWCTATVDLKTFLRVYNFTGGKLKAQFDAHKKAQQAIKQTGLNSEIFCKSTGGNYATRDELNQYKHLSPAQIAIRKANGIGEFAPNYARNIYDADYTRNFYDADHTG